MCGYVALDDESGAFGIEADGEPVECHVLDGLLNQVDVVEVVAECLVVGDKEVALVLVLELQPVLERAYVVS